MAQLRTEFEVTCPCCQSTLVIDEGLKRVVRHVEPERADKPKLDDAHQILADAKARRDALFEQSVASEKTRGDALASEEDVEKGIAGTQAFLGELYKAVSRSAEAGESLKQAYDKAMAALQPRYGNWVIFEHCLPFDVSRAYDEAKGLDHPRIWTAERDLEMWTALEKAD